MNNFMARYQTRVANTQRFGVITDAPIRAGTARAASLDVSIFVKLAYLLIGCAALVYFLVRMGQGGSLGAAAEIASAGLVFAVGALIVVFGVLVVGSSLRKQS
jgi:hypothetical protein